MKIYNQRMSAEMEGDFVVFLIGMRVNRIWKIWRWLPIFSAMPKMIKELTMQPERGYIHSELWFGRTTIMVQYWRSTDDLIRYSRDAQAEHLPAWKAFNRRIKDNGDVGIYHETYPVSAGQYESVYANMPRFGLAKAGNHIEAKGKYKSARGRLGGQPEDVNPEM